MNKFYSFGCNLLCLVAVTFVLTASSGSAYAFDDDASEVVAAPEVDPSSMTSALALLMGGGLLAADRIRRMAKAK